MSDIRSLVTEDDIIKLDSARSIKQYNIFQHKTGILMTSFPHNKHGQISKYRQNEYKFFQAYGFYWYATFAAPLAMSNYNLLKFLDGEGERRYYRATHVEVRSGRPVLHPILSCTLDQAYREGCKRKNYRPLKRDSKVKGISRYRGR